MKVYHVSPRFNERGLFEHYGFSETHNIEEANVIVFSGGEDVSPALYGQNTLPYTFPNNERDLYEINCYYKSLFSNKKTLRFGICRGHQLLAVLNGHKLIQDIPRHRGGTHKVMVLSDVIHGKKANVFEVNSLHHQVMEDAQSDYYDFWVLARSEIKKGVYSSTNRGYIESAYWRKSNSFGVQWHPEMMDYDAEPTKWIFNIIKEYLCVD